MELTAVPTNWANYIFGGLVAALLWVVRGYAGDVKHIKANYMTREEVTAAIAAQSKATAELFASHQASTTASFAEIRASTDNRHVENTANFRELRIRLDSLNDTLLKVALK
jgi:hypothetical protein